MTAERRLTMYEQDVRNLPLDTSTQVLRPQKDALTHERHRRKLRNKLFGQIGTLINS